MFRERINIIVVATSRFFSEMYNRLVAGTPIFFRKLQLVLTGLSFAAGLMLASSGYLPSWPWLPEAMKVCFFCGFFGTFIAQMTIKNPPNEAV
jgi:hypothetical protein